MNADVFLSASMSDRMWAEQVQRALVAAGWEVWWGGDRRIELQADVKRELTSARCVVVLWSTRSVASSRVEQEASSGQRRGVLVQASLDGVSPPPTFRSLACSDLSQWRQHAEVTELRSTQGFRTLSSAIARVIPPEGLPDATP